MYYVLSGLIGLACGFLLGRMLDDKKIAAAAKELKESNDRVERNIELHTDKFDRRHGSRRDGRSDSPC